MTSLPSTHSWAAAWTGDDVAQLVAALVALFNDLRGEVDEHLVTRLIADHRERSFINDDRSLTLLPGRQHSPTHDTARAHEVSPDRRPTRRSGSSLRPTTTTSQVIDRARKACGVNPETASTTRQ